MPKLSGLAVRRQYAAVINALKQRGFQQADIDKHLQVNRHPIAARAALAVFYADLLIEGAPKRLDAALAAGLSPRDLITAVKHKGSAEKIRTLFGCFDPIALPDGSSTFNWAMLMSQEGITASALLKLLSTIGSSHNLKALIDLFNPIVLASGGQTSHWEMLISQDGIDAAVLLKLVSTIGGSHNLKALIGLFNPIVLASGGQTSHWEMLISQEGIDAAALLALVSTGGGSYNLKALIDLFNPIVLASGVQASHWEMLIGQEGIDAAALLRLVSTGGGSHNLKALIGLFNPIVLASGVQSTRSQRLSELGVTMSAVIGILTVGKSRSGTFLAVRDLLLDSSFGWLFHQELAVVTAVMAFAKKCCVTAAHVVFMAQVVKAHKAFFLVSKVERITQLCAVISRVTKKRISDKRLVGQFQGGVDSVKKLADILKVKLPKRVIAKTVRPDTPLKSIDDLWAQVSDAGLDVGMSGSLSDASAGGGGSKADELSPASFFAARSPRAMSVSCDAVALGGEVAPISRAPKRANLEEEGGEPARGRRGSGDFSGMWQGSSAVSLGEGGFTDLGSHHMKARTDDEADFLKKLLDVDGCSDEEDDRPDFSLKGIDF